MNVPKLRFSGFKDEWQQLDLNKTFIYFSTNSLSRDQLSNNGTIKNVHYGDIHRKFSSIVNVENDVDTYIKDINYNNKYELCKNNDLIFADASEDYDGIGKAIEVTNIKCDTISGLHTILARDISNVFAPKFKGYYFNSPIVHNQIRILANGFKVYGISKDTINKLNVKIPAFKEQEKISNTLELLDKKIELQSKKIEDLKLFKKGLINNLVNNIAEYKIMKLKQLGITYSGLSCKSKEDFDNGNCHFINFISVLNDNINVNQLPSVKISANEKQNKVLKNDLFFNTSSETKEEVALCSTICDAIPNLYLNSFCFGFRINNLDLINNEYLNLLLHCTYYRRKISNLGQGFTRVNISKNELMELNIRVPNINNQMKIININNKLRDKIDFENNKLSQLIKLKKGLMQNMFV